MSFLKNLLGGHHGSGHGGGHHGGGYGHNGGYGQNGPIQKPYMPEGRACTQCQSMNKTDARFCQQCGSSLQAAHCTGCGTTLTAGAKFCGQCGKSAAG